MSPQTPFSLSCGSCLCVSVPSSVMAPESTRGSLDGENSSRRLHRVELATVMFSRDVELWLSMSISGFQTGWSWKVVRKSCTDRDRECRHLMAAICMSSSGSSRLLTRFGIRLSVSMIRFRISSSLAPRDANTCEKNEGYEWKKCCLYYV